MAGNKIGVVYRCQEEDYMVLVFGEGKPVAVVLSPAQAELLRKQLLDFIPLTAREIEFHARRRAEIDQREGTA